MPHLSHPFNTPGTNRNAQDWLSFVQQLWGKLSALYGQTHGESPDFSAEVSGCTLSITEALPLSFRGGCTALLYYPEPIPLHQKVMALANDHAPQLLSGLG